MPTLISHRYFPTVVLHRTAQCQCNAWIRIIPPTKPGRKVGGNKIKPGGKQSPSISPDFMSGSLVDALKKAGLDPMKNGQIRDAISSILEKDENKIAFANAVEKTKLNPIRLTKKILVNWLKQEGYI